MLSKIAFRNVGKSFRDYAIYVFTLVFAVCIFYMFNSIYAQQEIMQVTETTNAAMESLTKIMSYISIFVAVVLGFLIIYANNFFIKRRKKEFGIYMTLGMEKHDISKILVLETSLMAISSLFIGLILGVFGSQFMSVFTAKLFEADMTEYKFIFSPDAAYKSIVYFTIIFLVVILFNAVNIGKVKLIDLIYGGRKNETLKINCERYSVAVFIISCLCIGVAYYLILKNGIIDINNYVLMSVILGIIGTFLFFMSLSGMLIKFFRLKENLYFKDLNIFIFRQLTSKINTNFVSMTVVCLIMFMVIDIFSCGYSIQNALSEDLKSSLKYDFSLYNYANKDREAKSIYENLPKYIINDSGILKYQEYTSYILDGYGGKIEDYGLDLSAFKNNIGVWYLEFITLSDYNSIREIQGLPELNAKSDEYSIVYSDDIYAKLVNQFLDNKITLDINGFKLNPKATEHLILDNNNNSITMVINDELVEDMKINHRVLNLISKSDDDSKNLENKFESYLSSIDHEDWAFNYSLGKLEAYRNSVSTKLIVSFLAIYLGLVFMITSAAILAIQQLSESEDNKERYLLLKKLGSDKQMLDRALFSQIIYYFLTPLIVSIIHSIVGLIVVNRVIESHAKLNIGTNIITTSSFVLFIYGVYFIFTYIGSKNIINKA